MSPSSCLLACLRNKGWTCGWNTCQILLWQGFSSWWTLCPWKVCVYIVLRCVSIVLRCVCVYIVLRCVYIVLRCVYIILRCVYIVLRQLSAFDRTSKSSYLPAFVLSWKCCLALWNWLSGWCLQWFPCTCVQFVWDVPCHVHPDATIVVEWVLKYSCPPCPVLSVICSPSCKVNMVLNVHGKCKAY